MIYLSVLFAGKSGSPLVSSTRGSSGEESSNDVLFSAGSEPPASRLLQPSPSECAPEIRVKARAAGSFQTSASGKGGRLGLELAGPRKNSLFQVFLRDSGFIFFSIKRKENEANQSNNHPFKVRLIKTFVRQLRISHQVCVKVAFLRSYDRHRQTFDKLLQPRNGGIRTLCLLSRLFSFTTKKKCLAGLCVNNCSF